MGDAARAVYFAADSAAAHNTWGTLLAASGWLASAQRQFDLALALDPKATYAVTNSATSRSPPDRLAGPLPIAGERSRWIRNRLSRETTSP